MTITRQNIIDAYNSIYSTANNNILKTYIELTPEEIKEALLVLLNNNINIVTGGGSGSNGDASAANQIIANTLLNDIKSRTPILVNGKVPVEVSSLNVSIDNTSLEISNDVGNPIPVTLGGLLDSLLDIINNQNQSEILLQNIIDAIEGNTTVGTTTEEVLFEDSFTSSSLSGDWLIYKGLPSVNVGINNGSLEINAPLLTSQQRTQVILNRPFTGEYIIEFELQLAVKNTNLNIAFILNDTNADKALSDSSTTVFGVNFGNNPTSNSQGLLINQLENFTATTQILNTPLITNNFKFKIEYKQNEIIYTASLPDGTQLTTATLNTNVAINTTNRYFKILFNTSGLSVSNPSPAAIYRLNSLKIYKQKTSGLTSDLAKESTLFALSTKVPQLNTTGGRLNVDIGQAIQFPVNLSTIEKQDAQLVELSAIKNRLAIGSTLETNALPVYLVNQINQTNNNNDYIEPFDLPLSPEWQITTNTQSGSTAVVANSNLKVSLTSPFGSSFGKRLNTWGVGERDVIIRLKLPDRAGKAASFTHVFYILYGRGDDHIQLSFFPGSNTTARMYGSKSNPFEESFDYALTGLPDTSQYFEVKLEHRIAQTKIYFNNIQVPTIITTGNPLTTVPLDLHFSANISTLGATSDYYIDNISIIDINNTSNSSSGISISSLPLPPNAATETTLQGLRTQLPTTLVNNRLAVDVGNLQLTNDSNNPIPVSGTIEINNDTGNAIPVVVTNQITTASGGATETTLQAINAKTLTPVNGRLPVEVGEIEIKNDIGNPIPVTITNNQTGLATETTVSNLNNKIPSGLALTGDRLKVDTGSSGTVEITNDIGNPIPVSGTVGVSNQITGFSTENTLNQLLNSFGLQNATPATSDSENTSFLGLFKRLLSKIPVLNGRIQTDASVTFPTTQGISAATLPLPVGASTSANQVITNTTLETISSKLNPGSIINSNALPVYVINSDSGQQSVWFESFNEPVLGSDWVIVSKTSVNTDATVNNSILTVGSLTSQPVGQIVLKLNRPLTLDYLVELNAKISGRNSGLYIDFFIDTSTSGTGNFSVDPTSRGLALTFNPGSNNNIVNFSTYNPGGSPGNSINIQNTPNTNDWISIAISHVNTLAKASLSTLPGITPSVTRDALFNNTNVPSSDLTYYLYVRIFVFQASVNPAFIQIENVKVTTTTAYSNQSDAIVAKLDLINNKLPNNFNSIEVTNDVGNPLPVNIVNGGTTGGASELTLTTLNNKVTSNGGRIQVETQPITVNAGDATAANQTTGNNTLSAINTKVPTNLTVTNNRLLVDTVFPTSFEISNDIGNSIPVTITGGSAVGGATETTLSALNAKLPAQINSRLPVDIEQLEIVNDANNRIFTDTIISNLPPGAATETTLAALNNKVIVTGGRIQVETQPITLSGGGDATAANQITGNNTLSAINTKLPNNLTVTNNRLQVSTDFPTTQTISATALPLPTGAATETTLGLLNTKIPSNLTVTSNRLDVNTGTITISNQFATEGTDSTGVTQLAGGSGIRGWLSGIFSKLPTLISNRVPVDVVFPSNQTVTSNLPANAATESTLSALNNKVTSISGRVQTDIAATTLPLPTGASTSSLQTTGNTSLSNIDTKLPTGLTVTSNKLQTDSTVSGTVAISNQISGFSTETTLNTLNNKLTSTAGRLQTDANITGAVEIANDVGNPIPVNGTLAISNQITGFATAANQTTEITSLQNIDGKLPAIVNNSVRTSIIPLSLTGNGLPATVVNFDLFNISFGDFSSISIQIIGTFVATLAVQISDNNIDFVTVSCRSMTASGNSNTTVQTITVPGIYALNRSAKFIKLRTTAYTSGTVNAVYELNSLPILDDAKNIFIGGSVTVDTELAAAAALADGISGTLLTSTAGAANLVYNGTTFDRQRTMSAIANSEGLGRIKTSGNSQVFTLASVTGNTTTTVVALGTPFNNLYCQLIYPVGITDFEATIDGSLNGTDWYDLCTIPRIANGTKPATGTIFNALDNSFSATRLASFNNLRVRITNFTGTGTLVILASASENALSRPIATIQKIQEGSNIFNLATNANTITVNPVIDLSIPYNILYAQIILNGSITALEFTVEGSLNGTNWEIIRNYSNSNSGTIFEPHTPPLTSGNIINLTDGKPNYFGTSYLGGNYSDVIFRYLRLNINSITGSGTVTVIGACQTNQTKLSASVSENLRNLPIIGNSIENLTTIVNGLLFQKIFFTKEIRHSTIGVTPVSIAANTVTQLNDLTNSRDYALISNKTNTRIYLGFSDVSSTKYIDFIEANSTYKLTWALNPNVPPYAFSTVNSQILISNFVRDVSNF